MNKPSENVQGNPFVEEEDPGNQVYLAGGALGLLVGLLAAYFYVRAADESENRDGMETGDFIKIALSLITLIRQMTEMGSGRKS